MKRVESLWSAGLYLNQVAGQQMSNRGGEDGGQDGGDHTDPKHGCLHKPAETFYISKGKKQT